MAKTLQEAYIRWIKAIEELHLIKREAAIVNNRTHKEIIEGRNRYTQARKEIQNAAHAYYNFKPGRFEPLPKIPRASRKVTSICQNPKCGKEIVGYAMANGEPHPYCCHACFIEAKLLRNAAKRELP